MNDYTVTITEVSKEVSPKEKVILKNLTDAVKIDKATQAEELIINVDYYAELAIHNEKSDDKDYTNYVVVDVNGTKYVTGSPSFWNSFKNIMSEMDGVDEDWSLKVFRLPSKNREGKDFITCAIV